MIRISEDKKKLCKRDMGLETAINKKVPLVGKIFYRQKPTNHNELKKPRFMLG